MITRLRAGWHNVNASYWFYPAIFAVVAAGFALTTIWLDRNGWSEWLTDRAIIVPARPGGASNMLTVIAASMIGVASTVFSITIAAVVFASGTYGPRLLTNFMEDRGNQFSLATFIGTFVYALTILRSVRAEDEVTSSLADAAATSLPGFVPQLSLLVAYGLTGISIAVLVFFLNHIPDSIQINSVLHGIGSRLLEKIAHRYPEQDDGAEKLERPRGAPIPATGTGYIQLIDFEALRATAARHRGCIVMAVRVGAFIHPDITIAEWHPIEGGDAEPPADAVRDSFALGSRRTPSQDLDFLIDELVEITLRALSPAINDPFTAVTAIHWLGAACAELGRRDLREPIRNGNNDGPCRVVAVRWDFDDYLACGFGAMRGSVAGNRIAAQAMLDALADAATTLDNETRKAAVRRQGSLLLEQARLQLSGPELMEVEARHVTFDKAMAG